MNRFSTTAIASALASFCFAPQAAAEISDSISVYEFEEAVIVASPKETMLLRKQPISTSLFSGSDLTNLGINRMKGLSGYAPNFYMPSYGSRLTSAVYIRGIGSRINTPAVGLYVDNVPYGDKSAYDFSFIDVDRVDVLRGPQGTLYGRNSMGGLIRISTADPFTHSGTDIQLGATSRTAGRRAKAVTYVHPSSTTALSLGAYYEGSEGFWRNSFTGTHADGSDAGGGKIRFAWKPNQDVRVDLHASYEYSDEKANPYFYTGKEGYTNDSTFGIWQNRQSRYRRSLFNAGAGVEWKAPKFVFSSITAVQHLSDRLFMDQDFSASDIFSLTQKQRANVFSEELVMKSLPGHRWQWTSGTFVMHQQMKTTCPVDFHADGMAFLNRQMAAVLPARPSMSLTFTDNSLPFLSTLKTPMTNAAIYHQSIVDLGAGLSAIAGIRLDYEYRELRLQSGTASPVGYTFAMPSFGINAPLKADPALNGNLYDDSWQLLPKFALQYNHKSGRGNVYAAVSKGYRSGGYNIQSYSDLSQTMLRRVIMQGVREYSIETIKNMPGMPDAVKDKAIAGLTATLDPHIPEQPSISALGYKPEQSWNFEVGGHLNFFNRRLFIDYTFFYTRTTDQQIARFAESGLGREVTNTGKSRNCGLELSARSFLFDNRLVLTAAYGYTKSSIKSHYEVTAGRDTLDAYGNRIPFAPAHTLGASARWTQPVSDNGFVRSLAAELGVNGAGNIYWDEANTRKQAFYATLRASVSAELAAGLSIELWAENLTGARYSTFSFVNLGRQLSQFGSPRHFGVDLRMHF